MRPRSRCRRSSGLRRAAARAGRYRRGHCPAGRHSGSHAGAEPPEMGFRRPSRRSLPGIGVRVLAHGQSFLALAPRFVAHRQPLVALARGLVALGQPVMALEPGSWHTANRSWHWRKGSWHTANRSWHWRDGSWHNVQRSWHLKNRSWHDRRRSLDNGHLRKPLMASQPAQLERQWPSEGSYLPCEGTQLEPGQQSADHVRSAAITTRVRPGVISTRWQQAGHFRNRSYHNKGQTWGDHGNLHNKARSKADKNPDQTRRSPKPAGWQ